ncbi:TonB-linked SusC/RagA family outer membrane protein [Pedobacter metabolipauper]|uniref:TonB-linked SusC/RagA family outer membrane protein n=2 Tax=Pedobacter metabolipauper TaxID=425513 RepID=A0A4V3D1L3_9SPHI|nr:TonB-linked SusC/RagA family outer membrane protein [Pedobacter metabolipauper]
MAQTPRTVTGTVTDDMGVPMSGVSVKVKNSQTATSTDVGGKFSIAVPDGTAILQFIYVGFQLQEITVGDKATFNVKLLPSNQDLEEVLVTGYGTQKKEAVTGSIASISAKDIAKVHGGATVSTGLAGKIAGVSFRQADGRPGAGANIQIRNMGGALYVIDGIQQDEGQFNNLSPNDIETITVLKDGSAAIYGSRSANGVIIVTTKRGAQNSKNTIRVDAYTGWQNWTRFPETTNAYQWMLGKAIADVNEFGSTTITQSELDKWQQGTEYGYQSQNWRDLIVEKNAPQYSINMSASGGTDKINYYLSGTRIDQKGVYGTSREFEFNRTNIQSNVDAKITDRLKVGVQINGRLEVRDQPGVPGGDDYGAAKFALFRNRPTELAYANNNPLYPNNIGHNTEQFAVQSKEISGYWRSDWRVLQTNFTGQYDTPLKGLSLKGLYSYYLADNVTNGHEYTYSVYTYLPATDTYREDVGSSNPYRERGLTKQFNIASQIQANYSRLFGKHAVDGIFLAERIERRRLYTFQHAVPQTNVIPVLKFPTLDEQDYQDAIDEEARLGYVLKLNYNFANKYYVEFSGRRDASWKFAPSKRIGYFPSGSVGWRVTEEDFVKNLLGDKSILNEFKLRASYGILGDDNVGIGPFDYLTGYRFTNNSVILGGNNVTPLRDRGQPIDNITWFESKIFDVGADFGFFGSKLTGTVDYFYRKRTGLKGTRADVVVPRELGYDLAQENLNSDAQYGGEIALNYANNIGELNYRVGGNFMLSRGKNLNSYLPRFNNSWDQYRNSGEQRFKDIFWGYEVTGQFESQEQINNYPINIDGRGNSTVLPGDLIYKDVNGDGVIDGFDERPIGFNTGGQPNMVFGFTLGFSWKGLDLSADFSGGGMYTWNQNWEQRWAFQNGGALLQDFFDDSWSRANPFDVNSAWQPGRYPAMRYNNNSLSSYNKNSTFWAHNLRYLRARTIELGYALPTKWMQKANVQSVRIFANGYNLFSIDNVRKYGIDPEIQDDNGLQYPQNKVINFGIQVSL